MSVCSCMYVLCITIDADSSGVVGGSNNILSQAGVVTRIIQPNSVYVQTAISPHSQILVWSHLTDCRLNTFKLNHGCSTQMLSKIIVGYPKTVTSICCMSVLLQCHSCVATASQAVDFQPAAHRAESPAGPRSHWAQSDSLQWQARLQMPCKELNSEKKAEKEDSRKWLSVFMSAVKFKILWFDTGENYSMWVAAWDAKSTQSSSNFECLRAQPKQLLQSSSCFTQTHIILKLEFCLSKMQNILKSPGTTGEN